jgi:hypothetical protein
VAIWATLSETDQWKADPSRNPPASQMPNSAANGAYHRRLMIGPTAMHAMKLSMPRSRKPIPMSGARIPIPVLLVGQWQ